MLPNKKLVDLNTYPRLDIMRVFKDYPMPHLNTTCEVDITGLKRASDAKGLSFFLLLSHAVASAVNSVAALRHRVIDGELYEFERIDPGFTIARENDLFSFCDAVYHEDFEIYSTETQAKIDAVKSEPDLAVRDKNHMVFITSLPWFSFTSISHPYTPLHAYIPIISLGKYIERDGRVMMPVAIQVHHGVVDGIHIARFYKALEDYCLMQM